MRFLALLLLACLTACSGAHTTDDGGSTDSGPSLDECVVPTDCLVVPVSCCGSCGAATRGDAAAIARIHAGAYRGNACPDGADCPACAAEPDPTLLATCTAGRCVLVDLQTHAATECSDASECRVRAAECCECGASTERSSLVAVSNSAAYEQLVCEPTMACLECLPSYPPEFTAVCEMGRCEMDFGGP